MTTLAITVLGMIMILLTMGSFVSVELHLRRLSSGSNSSGGGSETAKKKNHRNNVLFDEFTSPKTQTTILHHSMAQNSNQAIQAKTTRGTSESTRVDPRPVLQTSPSRPHRKWAYAFLVGSCNPEKPGYRGFLYNVLLAARRLRSLGSVADVVLMIQMSTHTRETRLPQLEEQLLTSQGIQLRYIPKFSSETHEVFYSTLFHARDSPGTVLCIHHHCPAHDYFSFHSTIPSQLSKWKSFEF